MKRILVYLKDGLLAPCGGPLGYNYFLKQQIEKMGASNIHYIHGDGGFNYKANSFTDKIKNENVKYLYRIGKSIVRKFTYLYGISHKSNIDLDAFDLIHFHSTMDMYEIRDSLKKYKGTVVLQSHSPVATYKEIFSYLTPWELRHMNWFYKKLVDIDRFAFSRADYIIFPCPEAEEPYYNSWDEYSKYKELKKDCYRYLLTGTEKCYAKLTKSEIRNKYGIPNDAFVLCYVGRHNEIKGYDTLKKIGEVVLQKYPNAYFLVAGKEEPLLGLNNERWIEVGWTNDPHSIIAASDIFVLPNKETYFDLILLEALSLGKIILASNTGGNRYFKKIETKGVIIYNSFNEVLSLIDILRQKTVEEIEELEEANIKLFDKDFSIEVFGKNYLNLINSL